LGHSTPESFGQGCGIGGVVGVAGRECSSASAPASRSDFNARAPRGSRSEERVLSCASSSGAVVETTFACGTFFFPPKMQPVVMKELNETLTSKT
jgi:hypothetical protein